MNIEAVKSGYVVGVSEPTTQYVSRNEKSIRAEGSQVKPVQRIFETDSCEKHEKLKNSFMLLRANESSNRCFGLEGCCYCSEWKQGMMV